MLLTKTEFSNIVKSAPLISIDLCILKSRKLLLGKRINPPARNFFFVPGGRILKEELIRNALKRILRNELGFSIQNENYKDLINFGCYEHFYEDNFLGNFDFSTHYVVLPYLVPYELIKKNHSDISFEQHSNYLWINLDETNYENINIHPNTIEYLNSPFLKNYTYL